MPLPLEGIVVLDFSTLLPGPMATLMLAEAGAEVIKVEKPGGEDMRRFPPRMGHGSAPFAVLNAGKRSVEIDLKAQDAVRRLEPLLRRADILVEQFRPGVMDRLGLGYEAVRALNPGIIYCSITGYGQTGPRSQEAGHDINYQAVTGLLSLSPGTAAAPTVPPALVADIAGGAMPAMINILLALRSRDRTGQGTYLDIAMADAMFTFAWFGLAEGHATGRFPGASENMLAGGSPRYALYATADAKFLAVGALEQKFWDAFCAAIDLPEALRDDAADPAATRQAITDIVRSKTGEHWSSVLHPLDCCCTIVCSLEDAVRDDHFRARNLLGYHITAGADVSLPLASVPLAPVVRRQAAERHLAEPGEHTDELLGPST